MDGKTSVCSHICSFAKLNLQHCDQLIVLYFFVILSNMSGIQVSTRAGLIDHHSFLYVSLPARSLLRHYADDAVLLVINESCVQCSGRFGSETVRSALVSLYQVDVLFTSATI